MADKKNPPAISAISVKGFKAFYEEQRVEIRPLTLLAGANSSGKSSALQPLLLLKQTLEAPFDPGPLLLDGPLVRFTSPAQFFSRAKDRDGDGTFSIFIETSDGKGIRDVFRRSGEFGVDLVNTEMPAKEGGYVAVTAGYDVSGLRFVRDRWFFELEVLAEFKFTGLTYNARSLILSTIHVPGWRGNPSRSYRTTAVGDRFPGTFENYVASVILSWQATQDPRLGLLDKGLQTMELTNQVRAKPIDATQIEILVGRLPVESELVNIADVGFGVSQVLPVLVALLAAKPDQLVYLEEPELHLHPRAQQALATVLVDAANRGVRVVAETHSSILLLAVQTLVAEKKISPDKVMLHWFQQDARGATKVTSGEMDQLGAYGDWPEDFGEVEAAVDNRYLDAVESQVLPRKKRANK